VLLCAGAKESRILEADLPFAAAARPAHTISPLLIAGNLAVGGLLLAGIACHA
jgi:hypothetical protein